MMDFPIIDLMDEHACYQWLLGLLHPKGLACPRCGGTAAYVHRFYREPVLDYRCKDCGKVYNAFTGTEWQKTHFRPSQVVLIVRGFAQGRTTAGLARELGASRGHLLERRHRIQAHALAAAEAGATPLPDGTVEADEAYQNAGEKGVPHTDPADPLRRRANKAVGHGTWENDRVPIAARDAQIVLELSSGRHEICMQAFLRVVPPIRGDASTALPRRASRLMANHRAAERLGRPHSRRGPVEKFWRQNPSDATGRLRAPGPGGRGTWIQANLGWRFTHAMSLEAASFPSRGEGRSCRPIPGRSSAHCRAADVLWIGTVREQIPPQ